MYGNFVDAITSGATAALQSINANDTDM